MVISASVLALRFPHSSRKRRELFGEGRLRGRVGVHLALAASHDDVHEAAGVGDTLLRAALGDLLLLLLLDLLCGGLVITALCDVLYV